MGIFGKKDPYAELGKTNSIDGKTTEQNYTVTESDKYVENTEQPLEPTKNTIYGNPTPLPTPTHPRANGGLKPVFVLTVIVTIGVMIFTVSNNTENRLGDKENTHTVVPTEIPYKEYPDVESMYYVHNGKKTESVVLFTRKALVDGKEDVVLVLSVGGRKKIIKPDEIRVTSNLLTVTDGTVLEVQRLKVPKGKPQQYRNIVWMDTVFETITKSAKADDEYDSKTLKTLTRTADLWLEDYLKDKENALVLEDKVESNEGINKIED